MKHIIRVILILVLPMQIHAQGGGPDCATAIASPITLPYLGVAETTCGGVNDVNETTVGDLDCSDPIFFEGEDYLYAFTAPKSGFILSIFTSLVGPANSSLSVFEGCPTTGGRCIGSTYEGVEVNAVKNLGFYVEEGKTYVIVVDQADDPATSGSDCILQYTLSVPYPDTTCVAVIATTEDLSKRNASFENGDFFGWTRKLGTCCPINTPTNNGNANRQRIMSGTDFDPNTGEKVRYVCPDGGKFSARLGNDLSGNEAEALEYRFLVTPEVNGIVYKYAVVLQDPGHEESEQPRFQVSINGLKDAACGNYSVAAGPNAKCFESYKGLLYKNWSSVGIDLSDPFYQGKFITIRFATGDCSLGGHFGYAYVDLALTKMQITAADTVNKVISYRENDSIKVEYCATSGPIVLSAPDGFKEYLWSTGDKTQSIVVNNPSMYTEVNVELRSEHGFNCPSVMKIYFKETEKTVVNFNPKNGCINQSIVFENRSDIRDSASNYEWNFGDGTTSNSFTGIHTYNAPGKYKVVLKSLQGCTDSVVSEVEVFDSLKVSIQSSAEKVLKDEPFTLEANVNGGSGDYTYLWNPPIGDNKGPYTVRQSDVGRYILEVIDNFGCGVYQDTIEVLMKSECNFFMDIPSAISPNNDGINDALSYYSNCLKSFELLIFDRWGAKVFTSSNLDNVWKPSNLLPGAYVYLLKAESQFGDLMSKRGTLIVSE